MQPVHQAKTTGHGPRTTNKRRGFTLIELLMVILIISILITLITVAVSSAMKNARIAEVKADISSLEGALADFKGSFGKFPPSSIILYEVAENPATTAPESWDQNPRSKALIRSLWPQFDFSIARDINQDGAIGGIYEIVGPECLVFFLGGMRQPDGTTSALASTDAFIGFSKNPANPFAVAGTNRQGPFFEFQIDRFMDINDNDFKEYLDPLPGQTAPYIYLSSYDGTGYINGEAHASGLRDTATPPSPATGYYRQGSATGPGFKSKSFQIISAGADGEYGQGGLYDPDRADALLIDDRTVTPPILRAVERDNITNFQGGTLGDE